MYRTQMSASKLGRALGLAPAVGVALLSLMTARNAAAQSTIFNIPSTDTVDKGKAYGEIDVLPQMPGPDSGAATTIFNPRIVIGLPGNAEFGFNFPTYHNGDANPSNLAYIQPDLKVKVYKNDDMGMAISVGTIVNVAMNQRDAQKAWGLFYGNVSKKVKGDKGPRVTFGGFGVAQSDDATKTGFVGTKGGAMLGYEQPITGKVSFVADWFSGVNSIGYFTPGVSITLPRSGLLNIGYSMGNDSLKDDWNIKDKFLFVYYGITFP